MKIIDKIKKFFEQEPEKKKIYTGLEEYGEPDE